MPHKTIGYDSQVDTVYTDLKAAFDRVDHRILARLEKIGIFPAFDAWFGSMSKSVQQNVRYFLIPPEGSNLGPFLFIKSSSMKWI